MSRGEVVSVIGMAGTYIAGLTFDRPYWHVGLLIALICLLIVRVGFAIDLAEYNRRKSQKEICRKRQEEAERTKQKNKQVTFQNWVETRQYGTF